ncbi:MFS transporter [Georgenia sp. TF02-10]|uniref:MFS transporter n=1 Tax=Georgenia sp. TF02-10 TaxID=2917725 RepID=UPI001FA7B378|nr:MFS transporter [Georgenia sp. TF02-10]UNX53444.1 MFS transporter [Georgenia sp. TF02-10]
MPTNPLRSLRHYRELPGILGRSFLPVAFVARLPTAMVVLGVLTLLAAATGSVGDAGAGSASLAVATAVAGPLVGRWTDRRGQRLPLLLLVPVNVAALAGLVLAARAGVPLAALCLLCAVVGATSVPVGSLARARWLARPLTPAQTQAALSYESMADELVFVLGPALVGVAASVLTPAVPLILAAALVAVFVTAFALHPSVAGTASPPAATPRPGAAPGTPTVPGATTVPPAVPPTPAPRRGAAPPLPTVLRAVAVPAAAMVGVGMFFGATQAGVTGAAAAAGEPDRAGLVYAAMGVGSALLALAVVALPAGFGLRARVVVGGGGMAACAAAMTTAGGLGTLAGTVAVAGCFVGPTLVTLFDLAERRAPAGATAVAMTVLSSANVVGVAAGAGLAGRLADADGAPAAFVVSAVAAVGVAVVAALAPAGGPARRGGPVP